MSVAGIEETLDLSVAALRDVKARIRPLFTQERVCSFGRAFHRWFAGAEQRKTRWLRDGAAAGNSRARPWEADALRDVVRYYALETLADDQAVLVIDETGIL